MAGYVVPSVLVYQQLANAGGVTNSTPQLPVCIVGPAYNTLQYVPGSVSSQVLTAALSTLSTTGTILSGSTALTVASTAGFATGDSIQISGAGSSGAVLQATITNIAGNVMTISTPALTTTTSAAPSSVNGSGSIGNSGISNTFGLPGQKAGQVVDPTTIKVWMSNVEVETLSTGASGTAGYNVLTFLTNPASGVWTTGAITAATTRLTVASGGAVGLVVGDSVTVAGAGASGGLLTTQIEGINGNVLTVSPAAQTTVSGANVAKVLPGNVNPTTNTLVVEPGNSVTYGYTNINGVATIGTSEVKSVVTTSGANGTLVNISLNDTLPADFSYSLTGGINANSAILNMSQVLVSQANTSLSWANGVVTLTSTGVGTALVSPGTQFTVAGVTPAGYNGNWVVQSIPSADSVTYALATNPGPETSPGTVSSLPATQGLSVGSQVTVSGAGPSGTNLVATVTAISTNAVTLSATASTTTGAYDSVVTVDGHVSVTVIQTLVDQQLPANNPLTGYPNYSTATAATAGTVTIEASPGLAYGSIVSGNVYFGYSALRTDLSNRVLTFEGITDLEGQLGVVDQTNPLALGASIALANTTTRVNAIAVEANTLDGYVAALEVAEGNTLYALVPLTQEEDIIAAFQTHVDQMSTPQNAAWRVALVNTVIPKTMDIGEASATAPNANSQNVIGNQAGQIVLTSPSATFISDGALPGDTVNITAATNNGGATSLVGAYQILEVISNQQVVIQGTGISAQAVQFYISRAMTKSQSAAAVAATSAQFNDARVWHIQPDTVGISVNGVTQYLPGYYLACGLGGMVAGFPVQQGFTNIGVAGVADLQNSNFYFAKADINTMAAAGTCFFVQSTQGGIPYVRHELTTNMSVLQYQEMLVVKNWDFLSYYYYGKLQSFIGSWNVTPDTLNTLRQTITASSQLLITQKLPKIGPPLLGYTITSLAQDATNKDTVDCSLQVEVVYPLNYMNLYLVI